MGSVYPRIKRKPLGPVAGISEIRYIKSPNSRYSLSAKKLVIAIDGPAASGKSTTARLVAEKLGYLHVDTGAMYRAVTAKVLKSGIRLDDLGKIGALLRSTRIELRGTGGSVTVLVDGEDVTDQIRSREVTRSVSAVSRLRDVRQAMVREQRRMGEGGGIVLEGRDIGTVVFPNADLKIYLVADIEARARRRQRELEEQGIHSSLDVLRKEIAERDKLDSTREESPLRKADDAIMLDTSGLTIEEQVSFVAGKAFEIISRTEEG
jgi:cytidylate kinase